MRKVIKYTSIMYQMTWDFMVIDELHEWFIYTHPI